MGELKLICAAVLTGGLNVLLWAGAALVWQAAGQTAAAGPCRLGVGLLVASQLCSNTGALLDGHAPAVGWVWLLQTSLYFAFLYLLYHMTVLLSACHR